jgi:hypothetical protein
MAAWVIGVLLAVSMAIVVLPATALWRRIRR